MPDPATGVSLAVEVDASILADLPTDAKSLLNEAEASIASSVGTVMALFGIPGSLSVTVSPAPSGQPMAPPLRIAVDGRRLRYPQDLVGRVAVTLDDATKDERAVLVGRFVEFAAALCSEVVKDRAADLMSDGQVAAYVKALPRPAEDSVAKSPAAAFDPARVGGVLRAVLATRTSIADIREVAHVLAAADGDAERISEELKAELASSVIEIRLRRETLRQLTVAEPASDAFFAIRESLFKAMALRLPPLSFVVDADLTEASFAFRINHVPSLPVRCLQPSECLAISPPEDLKKLGIDSRPVWDPVGGKVVGAVGVADRPKLELMGVMVLGPLGHVARWLESDLRRHAETFVDQHMVKGLLDDLGTMFPVLVAAASVRWPVWRLTRVLRSIVAESVPCADLRFALERLLDYDRVLVSGADTVILADKLPVTGGGSAGSMDDAILGAEFLRVGLGPYLVGRLRSIDARLYRLDERLEKLVMPGRSGDVGNASSSPPDEATRDAILGAVSEAIAGSRVPFAILTASSEARPHIRQILAEEFPDAMVLSQQEVPLDAQVDAPMTIVPAG